MNLEKLNEQWNRAWFEKDSAFVERMTAPEYVYIAPNGQMLDRKGLLGVITSPTYKLIRGSHTEERFIELAPNVVLLLHHYKGTVSFQGRTFNEDQRCARIFVKRGRNWLVVFEQSAAIG